MPFATVHDRYAPAEIERFYADGLWQPETLFDAVTRLAADRPDKVFATDGTRSLTYAEVRDTALSLAAGFRRLGIGRGDRVAIQIPSWCEYIPIVTALTRIGAIALPIMPIYRDDDVGFVLDNAGARTAIVCGTFKNFDYLQMYRGLRDRLPELRDLIVVRPAGETDRGDVVDLESLIESPADIDPDALGQAASPDDPLTIVYSSGTTARPKGCLHTYNTFGCGARLLADAFAYSENDVQFNPSPITHTTGFVTGFFLPLLQGASVHLMEAWEPRAGLEHIAKFHTTAAVTATTFLQMMMDVYDPDQHDPSSMRLWVAAGAPIPAAFVERARRLLPRMQVLSLYGRTENVTTTSCRVDDDPQRSVTSDGRVFPGSDVKIVDVDGNEVPRGHEGDIAYKGPMHMLEYIHNPEETAKLFTAEGYSRSGDLGTMDPDGYVRVTGRLKDIVIRGGMNISVRQIEDLLTGHPAVAAVAVVGMPDERLGERICCFLVVHPGHENVTLSELSGYLTAQGLPIQKTPERLEILADLPTTATGKIQKHVLRAQIAATLRGE